MTAIERGAEELVRYWRGVRQRTRRLLPLVPDGKLEWAPAPGRWSFGDLFRHLALTERWMFAENAAARPSRYPGHGVEHAAGVDEVGRLLDRLHEESCTIFASLTDADLQRKTITPAGTPITTFKWLRAMVEHEAHHRGQISLMLGLLSVQPPQIFGLTEEEVRARSI